MSSAVHIPYHVIDLDSLYGLKVLGMWLVLSVYFQRMISAKLYFWAKIDIVS